MAKPPSTVAEFSADYWDAFRISRVAGARPSGWAMSALSGADAANRAFGGLVWHTLMGFELAPRGASGALVGWHIATDTSDKLVLDVDGTRTVGRMTFEHVGSDLLWTTMLRHHGRTGERMWTVLGKAHRVLAPRCLEHARRSLTDA
ncbi:hypothetical protein [Aeromicrobium sp.]|uniref:hypothetical protein n=1 Tax=Aeromicrobium sp. TaxID=1871063 RepID=UPI003C67128A